MNDMSTAAPTCARDQANESLGSLAVSIPGATAVFRRHKLDFCCGGQATLSDACAARGLDVDGVLREIQALQQHQAAPDSPEPAALIEHILQRYHALHRQQLPELIRMARRVEAVHRDHPLVPQGLAQQLEQMEQALLEHMAKEEQILFPMLRQGGHPMAVHPIGMMRHEHVSHGEQLERLAALTRQHRPPGDACNTWRALYAGTAQLTEDLMEHIHLENNLLFPGFETGGRH